MKNMFGVIIAHRFWVPISNSGLECFVKKKMTKEKCFQSGWCFVVHLQGIVIYCRFFSGKEKLEFK